MNRTIYAPSIDHLEEAQKLAENTNISITVGDCEAFNGLDFDRNLVQLLLVPKEKYVEFMDKVRVHYTYRVNYVNEWIQMNRTAYCKVINKNNNNFYNIKPLVIERNCIKFIFRPFEIGSHIFQLYVDDQKCEERSFEVYA